MRRLFCTLGDGRTSRPEPAGLHQLPTYYQAAAVPPQAVSDCSIPPLNWLKSRWKPGSHSPSPTRSDRCLRPSRAPRALQRPEAAARTQAPVTPEQTDSPRPSRRRAAPPTRRHRQPDQPDPPASFPPQSGLDAALTAESPNGAAQRAGPQLGRRSAAAEAFPPLPMKRAARSTQPRAGAPISAALPRARWDGAVWPRLGPPPAQGRASSRSVPAPLPTHAEDSGVPGSAVKVRRNQQTLERAESLLEMVNLALRELLRHGGIDQGLPG